MTQMSRQNEQALLLPATADRSLLLDFLELTKLRISLMVVVTAYVGFAVGRTAVGFTSSWWQLTAALLGVALACMGAATLNQVCEVESDARMQRTRRRPLPAGRISLTAATIFGVALAGSGVVLLAVFTHAVAAVVAVFTIVSYLLAYTPMKRISQLAILIGAGPGALPPVIGYAAATGGIGREAVVIFAIMFLWQIPHFLAIAYLYRRDYGRGGLALGALVDRSHAMLFGRVVLSCVGLFVCSLLPVVLGMAGRCYLAIAVVTGIVLILFGLQLAVKRSRRSARWLFVASVIYLPVVLIALLIDGI